MPLKKAPPASTKGAQPAKKRGIKDFTNPDLAPLPVAEPNSKKLKASDSEPTRKAKISWEFKAGAAAKSDPK